MDRRELTDKLHALINDPGRTSNIKFFKLVQSRLLEEDIPLNDSNLIAGSLDYDFSNIPEDDDSLSEFATAYATYAAVVYKAMKMNGIKDITPVVKLFSPFKLEISGL